MEYKRIKRRTFDIIGKAEEGDRLSRYFDLLIMLLIALSILSIILESFQDLHVRYNSAFHILETLSVSIFTIEYLLRIWTADLLYPNSKHPRMKYILSFMALIDLLAILPFYLPFFSADLRFLRMIRLFRLFRLLRVFKLGRYFEAFQIIVKVLHDSGPQLVMSVVLCFFVMLFSAIIMYTVENPVQPDQFPNTMASLWWAMCTLTTVGYGDIYPITSIGRFFASVISLVGIGIIAIPTGIIAAGFSTAINKQKVSSEEDSNLSDKIESMSTEELLDIQQEICRKLIGEGVMFQISIKKENEESRNTE